MSATAVLKNTFGGITDPQVAYDFAEKFKVKPGRTIRDISKNITRGVYNALVTTPVAIAGSPFRIAGYIWRSAANICLGLPWVASHVGSNAVEVPSGLSEKIRWK